MKLALISPPFDLFKEGYGTNRPIKKGYLPPLGVGYIAAAAKRAGWETSIIDASSERYTIDETYEVIAHLSPDIIGISSMTSTIDRAGELSAVLKKRMPLTPIVLGGPHATCFAEETLRKYASIDYVVIGEGEGEIGKILGAIIRSGDLSGLSGLAYRDAEGKIHNNGKAPIVQDLDEIDPPTRELYNAKLYSPLPYSYRQLPATTMITSRGCPYSKCKFCFSSGRMRERYRRHSPERVVAEMKELYDRFGIREIVFCDDNFIFNKKWILKFRDLLKAEKLALTWSCAARVDSVDPEMLKAVHEVGCWTVFYGLESGVQSLLDMICKGITTEEVRNAVKWTHEAGMETRGSFMLALPGETPELAKETIQFAIDLNLTYAQFTLTFPDPGTELYDIAKERGKMAQYRGMTKATFIPDGYKDEKEVEDMVHLAYKRFYMRPGYVLRKIMSIRKPSDIARYIEGFLFLKGLT